ncbi:MAG: hypothetical protein ABFS12_18420, partial [Bacteroidota bacterium]
MKVFGLMFIYLCISSILLSQTSVEFQWTNYYEPIENKIVGIWPHNDRYLDISRIKELKHRWGFNNILLARNRGQVFYDMLIDAGFDSLKIMRQIRQDSYQENVESIPQTWAYYIDEPADKRENLTVWGNITEWIKNKYPNTKIVISGYKRDSFLKDYVNTIADYVMFSSYKHWWEFLGIWIAWPENPDQRSDWSDMKNLFGNKFSFTWIGAHRDLSEYNDLLAKAKALQLSGVYLYQLQPADDEVNDSNLESFSNAASKYGFTNKQYQQVRDLYNAGVFVNRKLVGPKYLSSIPNTFDHSILTFENYTVTNNRIEDY